MATYVRVCSIRCKRENQVYDKANSSSYSESGARTYIQNLIPHAGVYPACVHLPPITPAPYQTTYHA